MEDSARSLVRDQGSMRQWRRSEARWRVGSVGVDVLRDAAAALVSAGAPASPAMASLVIPSGADDPRDVRGLVEQVLSELGLEPLSQEEATRTVIAEIADQIASGIVEPEVGAREMWRAASALPIQERPNAVIALSSDWDRISPQEQGEVRAEIIGAARDLLVSWRARFPGLPV